MHATSSAQPSTNETNHYQQQRHQQQRQPIDGMAPFGWHSQQLCTSNGQLVDYDGVTPSNSSRTAEAAS